MYENRLDRRDGRALSTSYVKSSGYCLDLCGNDLMDWWSHNLVTGDYDAHVAWCNANIDCLGFGDHYRYDRVYLTSRLVTNPALAACANGIGLSSGQGASINNCYVKTATSTVSHMNACFIR